MTQRDMPLELAELFSVCTFSWANEFKYSLHDMNGNEVATGLWAAPHGNRRRYWAQLPTGERIEAFQPIAFTKKLHAAVTRARRPKTQEKSDAR